MLKVSTAATVVLGPFVDSTDGVTAETGLTIAQADIRLSKNGGAFAQTNNATGATHMENGYYSVPLDTTDTGTLGRLRVAVNESGALPVWIDLLIVTANVWDTFHSTDILDVSVTQISGAAVSTSSAQLGVNAVQVGGATPQTAADIADQVWDEALSGHTTAGTAGANQNLIDDIDTTADAILVDTAEIGAAGAGLTVLATAAALATVDTNVDSILADTGTDGVVLANSAITAAKFGAGAIDAAALATDAVNEIADGVLDRNMATGTDSGSATVRTIRQALRALRNKVSIAAGTLTVTKEDDTTASWTAEVTTAAGDPIDSIDPASA